MLKDLAEKILRMYSIITRPQDHTDYPDQARLMNTIRPSRQVRVRDLVKWCRRAQEAFIMILTSQKLQEMFHQDAVDILSRFIPDMDIRQFIA